jgi:hypothetical protein
MEDSVIADDIARITAKTEKGWVGWRDRVEACADVRLLLAEIRRLSSAGPGPSGRSTWVYDHEMDIHYPCCSERLANGRVCGNGPLTGDAVMSGRCSNDHKATRTRLIS